MIYVYYFQKCHRCAKNKIPNHGYRRQGDYFEVERRFIWIDFDLIPFFEKLIRS
jgi:hypothetical protein